MSNFAYLKQEWPELGESALKVERLALTDPRTACFYARRTLEIALKWLFDHDQSLRRPYDDTLSALLHEPTFRRIVPEDIYLKSRVIKDLGNEAVHSQRPVVDRDSTQAARELFHILYWIARTYTRLGADQYKGLEFDPNALSAGAKQAAATRLQTAGQLLALQAELKERDRKLEEQQEALLQTNKTTAELDAEIARLKAEIAAAKKLNEAIPDDHDYSEKETRDFFIDLLLREAGWPLANKEDREYPVEGMPNGAGKGWVDYVLWGANGLPLAVVEAKKTRKDARIGQQQAKLYADCLEAKFGQRPIVFYTNGYETWIWDDLTYPPRAVQGFYKRDELERLIERRTSKKPLGQAVIDSAIVERDYQILAIRSVTEAIDEKSQRRALLVMATGSGKTRTVIALCDLLQRCSQIKNVLFLADRVALVKQAKNAFNAHLPGSSPINLVTEKEDIESRVLLSTYPTMMGLIDEMKDGARRFGPGHFDLIVIDEAHRSVYQKYGAIFSYFDSLLVGLTATPRAEVDKNTYRLFDLERGVPTFAYELEEAVRELWLVPFRAISVPLKFQREGISYDKLSEEEREEWDSLEWDEEGGEAPDKVDASAVNNWLFNTDTVDKVLQHLMTKGLKVDGGDRLGKTIIFAKNHAHAMFIQERFDKNYPHLKGSFARVIDHKETYAASLLDAFCTPEKCPHIAISVDMLDTGIDVPEIVNLVFFKLVRSKTKFFQMIGRGTRLCEDLFGPNKDKECFYIFDYCQNLEFFGENPDGIEGGLQEPLAKKLFLRRLELILAIRAERESADGMVREHSAAYFPLDMDIANLLHAEVSAMSLDNFLVRPERRLVEQYGLRPAWDTITPDVAFALGERLAGLPSARDPEDITARQFDLLLLNLQLARLKKEPAFSRLSGQVVEIARLLEAKQSIPMVSAQLPLILEVQTEEFWVDTTLQQLEGVRKQLRSLVQFIEKRQRTFVYTDFEDEIGQEMEVSLAGMSTTVDVAQYRKKVTHFLNEHLEHPVVLKVRFNEPLTRGDLSELEALLYSLGGEGTQEKFAHSFGRPESLGVFVRKLVGLDREAATTLFGKYLEESRYNSNQIRFIKQIIEYLTQNGTMDQGLLYQQPFTSFSALGLDGLFPNQDANDIVNILAMVNRNAGISSGMGLTAN